MGKNTNNTKAERNELIAMDRSKGLSYGMLAKKYGLSKGGIQGVLSKSELKGIIDQGTSEVIALIPQAVNVHAEAMSNKDNPALALKAAETVLKTGAIIPSNTTNQTVNNLYLIQNNVTLSAGVAKALKDMSVQDDPDVVEAEIVDSVA